MEEQTPKSSKSKVDPLRPRSEASSSQKGLPDQPSQSSAPSKSSGSSSDSSSEASTKEEASGKEKPSQPSKPSKDIKGANWYVVHTYSGHEAKVAATLKQRIQSQKLEGKILDIL